MLLLAFRQPHLLHHHLEEVVELQELKAARAVTVQLLDHHANLMLLGLCARKHAELLQDSVDLLHAQLSTAVPVVVAEAGRQLLFQGRFHGHARLLDNLQRSWELGERLGELFDDVQHGQTLHLLRVRGRPADVDEKGKQVFPAHALVTAAKAVALEHLPQKRKTGTEFVHDLRLEIKLLRDHHFLPSSNCEQLCAHLLNKDLKLVQVQSAFAVTVALSENGCCLGRLFL
mmetsp:Transcript_25773/g.48392  ORF Transcript_25773/g.48392 Transcript_25773/m.48392 type:complete len:230 (+) Transcript_25773:632-1321(+)